jgi:hypothetical protein
VDGDVWRNAIATFQLDRRGPEGIVMDSKGVGYLADWENHAMYWHGGFSELSRAPVPDRILGSFETR